MLKKSRDTAHTLKTRDFTPCLSVDSSNAGCNREMT